jgi:NAD(P)-dependent dehydrogenase (short-subunit alcohol dehydrogenase family)
MHAAYVLVLSSWRETKKSKPRRSTAPACCEETHSSNPATDCSEIFTQQRAAAEAGATSLDENQRSHMSSEASETKVCLLTGASGTIGYAIAKALKASSAPATSWHVIIIGRRPPPQSITNVDGKAPEVLPYDTFLKAEMTSESSVASTLTDHFESLKNSPDANLRSLNRLDLLINCAGCSLGNVPIVDIPADTFREVMEVNLIVPFIFSKWAMTKMAACNPPGGRIINIGSIAVESPRLHAVPYTTSKIALGGLTRALSIEGRSLAKTTKSSDVGEGFVAVCQINPGNVRSSIMSPEEAARREREEGFVEADDIGKYVAMVANFPIGTNVLESTVMPTRQPLVGRG